MKNSTKLLLAGLLMITGVILFLLGVIALSGILYLDTTEVHALLLKLSLGVAPENPIIPLLVYFLPAVTCLILGGNWHQNILDAKAKARTQAFIKTLN